MDQSHIRNFAIIAHIDHGKSTLADRLMEETLTVAPRDMQQQLLDSNPIERERGITIKLAPVRMHFKPGIKNKESDNKKNTPIINPLIHDSEFLFPDNEIESRIKKVGLDDGYILNLIDTPGHVDFSYEVSRSLAACEGAILLVDATQGVQAQTLAHLYQARKNNLTIIPVINKIDIPFARVDEVKDQVLNLGFNPEELLLISAKTGQNVHDVLKAIIERIPPPIGNTGPQTRALVFSSQYDIHKGVVVFVRVVDGRIGLKEHLLFMASGSRVEPIEIGYFSPKMVPSGSLVTGEVGYIATGLKDIKAAKVGDTLIIDTSVKEVRSNQSVIYQNSRLQKLKESGLEPLPGYKEPKPMVYLGLFPISNDEFVSARESMEKLRLSDSAFTFRPIFSVALGNGFQCGFLGLLHAEIVQERILREFGLTMLATAPSVEYHIKLKSQHAKSLPAAGKVDEKGYARIAAAAEYPDPSLIEEILEPVMQVTIYTPKQFVGAVMILCQEKRGDYIDLKYEADQAVFTYLLPLSEMIIDFFDRLKSVTEGYASLDYEFFTRQKVSAVKVDILVNYEKVDAFAFLVVREQAETRSRQIVDRLAQAIPRQQFNIPIQAAIGGQVIARADIKPYRKDVIQKLYGGDRTRKDKLLNKQKKGKAKMKMIGRVEIPQRAFFDVLKR